MKRTARFVASICSLYQKWIEPLNHLWFQNTWAVTLPKESGISVPLCHQDIHRFFSIFKEVENPLENHFVKVFLGFSVSVKREPLPEFWFKWLYCIGLRIWTMVTAANKLFNFCSFKHVSISFLYVCFCYSVYKILWHSYNPIKLIILDGLDLLGKSNEFPKHPSIISNIDVDRYQRNQLKP